MHLDLFIPVFAFTLFFAPFVRAIDAIYIYQVNGQKYTTKTPAASRVQRVVVISERRCTLAMCMHKDSKNYGV